MDQSTICSSSVLTHYSKVRGECQLAPLIEIIGDIAALGGINLHISFTAVRVVFHDDDFFVQDPCAERGVEESIRLVLGDDAVETMGQLTLLYRIVLLADTNDELVRLR